MLAIDLPILSFDVHDSMKPATANDSLPRDSGYQSVSYPSLSTVPTNSLICAGPPSLSVEYHAPSRPSCMCCLHLVHGATMMPLSARLLISGCVKPASASTSALCSPTLGGCRVMPGR